MYCAVLLRCAYLVNYAVQARVKLCIYYMNRVVQLARIKLCMYTSIYIYEYSGTVCYVGVTDVMSTLDTSACIL